MSVCSLFFKIPLPRGGLILLLSFPQALSTEFRVHWRGGHARSAQTGLRWSPGPMNSFFRSITTNKARGGNGIPVELFQILKYDAVKVLHSICQQIWKTQQWPQDWKRSVFIPIPKKGNAKECSNYHTIALISHASKVMLTVLEDS